MKQLIILSVVTALVANACHRAAEQKIVARAPEIAACDLVTQEEVAAIQGTTINAASNSEGAIGPLLATQCYYSSAEPNKSVTLGVIQKRPGQPGDPVAYWRETFSDPDEDKDREKGKKGGRDEAEEKRTPPTKVSGVGDEAYWAAGAIGGTFYVLKKEKHVFLRVSVGGPDSVETKLSKSKQIAEKALERL